MHHAALELGLDIVWIDGVAWINPHHNAVNFDLLLRIDGDFTNASRITAVAFGLGNSAKHALGQRSTVVGRFGNSQQNCFVFGTFFRQPPAVDAA